MIKWNRDIDGRGASRRFSLHYGSIGKEELLLITVTV